MQLQQHQLTTCCCRQFERQYVFVAATLPSEGKKSIANDLRRMFPELVWLAGNRLHQGLSTVTWAWQETTQETWKTALQVLPTILCIASCLPDCCLAHIQLSTWCKVSLL